MAADKTASTSVSQTLVLFILPAVILGILAVALFFDFLGTQATEIAKLIDEIEISCRADLLSGLGLRQATETGAVSVIKCAHYLPKIALFFILIALWCFIANVVTLKVFALVRRLEWRVLIAVIVATLLPAILLYKYWIVAPPSLGSGGLFAAVIVIETIALEAWFAIRVLRSPDRAPSSWLMGAIFFGSIVVFVILSLLFAYYPVNLFNQIGSINTIVLYLLLAYGFLGGLFYYGRETGVPFIGLLLIWVVVIDALGITHGNEVAVREVKTPQPTGDQQFVDWFAARRDRAAFGTKDYPVYIVASAGGGTYAGMRSAYFLDFLQARCPSFAHHVFAISGVSGGGLGALAFASQQQGLEQRGLVPCDPVDGPQTGGAMTKPTPILDDFFAKDLLSTLIGAGLFPNMLQRVLPWPIEAFDRSQAFRKALGENWREALKNTAARTPSAMKVSPSPKGACSTLDYFVACEMASYWTPAGDAPALLFNTTDVDTGAPFILSNLGSRYYVDSIAARWVDPMAGTSINLIDAASLSARFPVALPAGFVEARGIGRSVHLVDGGYFDSSGMTMAYAVKAEIDKIAKARNLPIKARIIVLGEDWPVPLIETKTSSVAEIAAHLKALLLARDQRGVENFRQLFRADPSMLLFRWNAGRSNVELQCGDVPLAWYLAPCTQTVLKSKLRNALEDSDGLATLRNDLAPQ